MRFLENVLVLLASIHLATAIALPSLDITESQYDHINRLAKRRGGGGGGRGGGSSGGSSGSSGSSGSGSTGSSGTGSTGSTGAGGTGSTGSSGSSGSSGTRSGGTGTSGSGTSSNPRSYGGGNYYAGGAGNTYRSGGRSPLGIAPFFLPVALLGGIWAGAWLGGAYGYPYGHNYYYNNAQGQNTSYPVLCLCSANATCGCDDNDNTAYISSLSSNGTVQGLDPSVARLTNVNGTDTIVINGTVPAGSTSAAGFALANRNPFMYISTWFTVALVSFAVYGL